MYMVCIKLSHNQNINYILHESAQMITWKMVIHCVQAIIFFF